jgi:hypothetical protein
MRLPATVMFIVGALFLTSAPVAQAQPAAQPQAEKFTFKDGTITFDRKGFKEEFDKMQRDLAPRGKKSARALFKNTYCIDCGGPPGEKLTCRAVVGGRIGKGLCLLGGAASCSQGVASVTEGAC